MKQLTVYILFFLLTITLSNANTEKVSLQLQWKHQFEFAGYYMAKEKGFYEEVGLDVDIKEFEYHINIVEDVVANKTTYATNYSNLVQDRANGKDIVLLSAMMQSSPHILVSLKSSGIKSISDFKNKRIMINSSAQKTAVFTAMLKANKVYENDLIKVKHTFNIQDLIDGKTDLVACFSSNELFVLDEKGIEYDIWNPKDYGFDFYDVILFTSAKELENNPKRVEDFRTASLKGWKYAFSHIEETVDLILKKYNTQNKTKEALIYEANTLKKLAYLGSDTLGHIDKTKIKNIYGVYNLSHLVSGNLNLDTFIYKRAMEDSENRHKIDLELVKNISIVMLIIFFLVAYRHFILRRVNEGLHEQIKKEVEANRLKDNILYQQQKMAEMGEIIASIAHQWKQPLAVLNVTSATLKEKNTADILSKEELNDSLADAEVTILQMSQTMEDFLSYFNPTKNKEDFSLLEAVEKAILIISQTLRKEEVEVSLEIDENLSINGFKEEYIQVLITIFVNATEALKDTKNKSIRCKAYRDNDKNILEISDNAGGISKDIIHRIFEPYFTTKHQSQGTGLGLHIAKMIIENSMGGSLSAENIKDGVKLMIIN